MNKLSTQIIGHILSYLESKDQNRFISSYRGIWLWSKRDNPEWPGNGKNLDKLPLEVIIKHILPYLKFNDQDKFISSYRKLWLWSKINPEWQELKSKLKCSMLPLTSGSPIRLTTDAKGSPEIVSIVNFGQNISSLYNKLHTNKLFALQIPYKSFIGSIQVEHDIMDLDDTTISIKLYKIMSDDKASKICSNLKLGSRKIFNKLNIEVDSSDYILFVVSASSTKSITLNGYVSVSISLFF